MDKIDTKLIAHVSAEIIVIGGITFYFSRQIKDLQNRVENLEKENSFYRQAIETHESYLRDILGAPNPRPTTRPRLPSKPKSKLPRQPQSQPSEDKLEFPNDELDTVLDEEIEELDCDDESCHLNDNSPNGKNEKANT